MIGPGKYDDECTAVREKLVARGVLLIVIEGAHGGGFSAQCDADTLARIPEILEEVARQIRRDRRKAAH